MLNETRMLVVNCSSQDAQHHTFHIAVRSKAKLQALVHEILPPYTAIVDYAIGLPKLTDNHSFSLMLKWQCVCNRQFNL